MLRVTVKIASIWILPMILPTFAWISSFYTDKTLWSRKYYLCIIIYMCVHVYVHVTIEVTTLISKLVLIISTFYHSQLFISLAICLSFLEFTSHVHVVTRLVARLLPWALSFPFSFPLSPTISFLLLLI